MSLRTSSLALAALLLTGCGVNTSPEPEGETIECAIGPGAQLERDCIAEKVSGSEFVIHRPDGGFRRFAYDPVEGYSLGDGAVPLETFRRSDIAATALRVGSEDYVIPDSLMRSSGSE